MSTNFKKHLLSLTSSSSCEFIEEIQSLWGGYGNISRYKLVDSSLKTVVVKCISLLQPSIHPRGWNSDLSHSRKVKSYEIETEWYKSWANKCNNDCTVPLYLGSLSSENERWIVMEDIDFNYPSRKNELKLSEVRVCLKWLANFHGTFLNSKPKGLWEIGTYWNLSTRPEEFAKIESKELKSKAHLIDQKLNNCLYKTIVHGDAKLANFCFSKNGKKVAAVDFQYVGGGCGMKDVAYFIGSCLSEIECREYEKELLNFYFSELEKGIKTNVNFKELEYEWRGMYLLAVADFSRFLIGWMPEHNKLNNYSLGILKSVLDQF